MTNAVRVLKAFSPTKPEWGVSELARHLRIGKSTAHRLLATLADEGLLDQDPSSGAYHLGPAVTELTTALGPRLPLHEAVESPMAELRNCTYESVQVSVLDDHEVVCVEHMDSPMALRASFEIGQRLPSHSCATGKALLASCSPAELSRFLGDWELEATTECTVTSEPDLLRELALSRHRGWAEDTEEAVLGVMSIAAPIHDRDDTVVAAMGIAGPVGRVGLAKTEIAAHVVRFAAESSHGLGQRS